MSVVNHPNPMRGPWEGPLDTTAAGNLVDDRRLEPGHQPCRLVQPTLALVPMLYIGPTSSGQAHSWADCPHIPEHPGS